MSRSNGHVSEGCTLSLLALLLRLVLARTDPLKFSVNLDGIKISGSGRKIKRFPVKLGGGQARREKKKPGGGQTASRGGEGRYISAQDKSAFHGVEARRQEQPQRGEHVAPCHLPLSSFSDLKINKRQVQRHEEKKELRLRNSAKLNLHTFPAHRHRSELHHLHSPLPSKPPQAHTSAVEENTQGFYRFLFLN